MATTGNGEFSKLLKEREREISGIDDPEATEAEKEEIYKRLGVFFDEHLFPLIKKEIENLSSTIHQSGFGVPITVAMDLDKLDKFIDKDYEENYRKTGINLAEYEWRFYNNRTGGEISTVFEDSIKEWLKPKGGELTHICTEMNKSYLDITIK